MSWHLNNNLKQLIKRTPDGFFDKSFAVIGLGTGMLACIARPNQTIDFFEIDPLVAKIASDSEQFTYLRDCPGKPKVIIGDGRQEIARKSKEEYKLIVLDAFNSNAIPVHLLTYEAIETYLDKLDTEQGLLAFNIISKHSDLEGVLARVAQEHGIVAYHKRFEYNPEFLYDGVAEWVFMIRKDSPWHSAFQEMDFTRMDEAQDTPLWTDDYSSVVSILK